LEIFIGSPCAGYFFWLKIRFENVKGRGVQNAYRDNNLRDSEAGATLYIGLDNNPTYYPKHSTFLSDCTFFEHFRFLCLTRFIHWRILQSWMQQ
jgi:hypothetical protein